MAPTEKQDEYSSLESDSNGTLPEYTDTSPRHFQPYEHGAEVNITQRILPHWKQAGTTYFITFRLADSLPATKLRQWMEEKDAWHRRHPKPLTKQQHDEFIRLFPHRLHAWLDAGNGKCLMAAPHINQIVENALRHFDGERYILDNYVVMPNHVHVLVAVLDRAKLERVLHSWKSFTAHEINKHLEKSGVVWQGESFDHIVRSVERMRGYRAYIQDNPKNAGLKKGTYQVGRGIGVLLGDDIDA